MVKGNLQLMLSDIEKDWFPPLPKISNKRSMIYVDSLVRAILLVAANGKIFFARDGIPLCQDRCPLSNLSIQTKAGGGK